MRNVFKSDILSVRRAEDCIRATKKYTKGAFHSSQAQMIQGENFPSRTLTEYYEIYPDLEISWEMMASDAWAWVWGDVTHIDVRFHYDYRDNKAQMVVYGGLQAVKELARGIPELGAALDHINKVTAEEMEQRNNYGNGNFRPELAQKQEPEVLGHDNRVGADLTSHP